MCLEVRDRFLLVHEDLGRLGDIFETCFILLAQLAKLGTTKEELRVRETFNGTTEGLVLLCICQKGGRNSKTVWLHLNDASVKVIITLIRSSTYLA